jgi:hypothetical protein
MTAALAVFGSVVCICASALLAWRWWLSASLTQAAQALQAAQAARDTQLRSFEKELGELGNLRERLKALEYRQK